MERSGHFRLDLLQKNGLHHLKESYEWYIEEAESNAHARALVLETKDQYKKFLRFFSRTSPYEYGLLKKEMIDYYRGEVDEVKDFLGEGSDPELSEILDFSSEVLKLLMDD